jgi:hypothetical protein
MVLALKNLVASKAELAEADIEGIVSEYIRYDADEKEVTLTPAGAALPIRAKVLVYLVALQGWPFVLQEQVPTDATPAEIGDHLGMAGGSVRPTLTYLRDKHLVVAKGRRYAVRASNLRAAEAELAAVGTQDRSGAGFKLRRRAKEPNGPSAPKRNGKVRKQRSLAAKFNGWIEHGYFDEPRTLANVQKKFQQAGLILPRTSIPQYLLKAVRDGRLLREEAEVGGRNVWTYQTAK